jgi:hypothetical protein
MSNKFLDPPPAASRDKASFELLRVWVAEQGQHVSLRSGAWEDPFAWGIVLADLARHRIWTRLLSWSGCWKGFRRRSTRPRTSLRARSHSNSE